MSCLIFQSVSVCNKFQEVEGKLKKYTFMKSTQKVGREFSKFVTWLQIRLLFLWTSQMDDH